MTKTFLLDFSVKKKKTPHLLELGGGGAGQGDSSARGSVCKNSGSPHTHSRAKTSASSQASGGPTLSATCHRPGGRHGGRPGAMGALGPEGRGPRNQRPFCSVCRSLVHSQAELYFSLLRTPFLRVRRQRLNQPGRHGAECRAEQDLPEPGLPLSSSLSA